MNKVAIWGSMNHGNFGDDVMNILFALHLKKIGCTPFLYRLNKKLAKEYELISVDNLDLLLENAKFSIIGGGSWLESRKLGDSYEQDFIDYLDKINFYRVPFYAISIGGDSKNEPKYLTNDRIQLFSSDLFLGGTVRLESNLLTLSALGKKMLFYPDIILLSSNFFGKDFINSKTNNKFIIAIAQSNHILFKRFIKKMKILSFFYRDIEIYFLRTHLPDYKYDYEYQMSNETNVVKNKKYENLEDFFKFLHTIDIMVSSKLHPGVAALSCGKAFLWIPGLDKTRSFLKTVKLDKYEVSLNTVLKLILSKKIKKIGNLFPFEEIEKQKILANGHLEYLSKIAKDHCNL